MSTPRATYRIQLRPGFGFDDAAAVADYLARLGVSHVYASPYLQAAEGSTHGYDVVDPTRVSAELGGEAGHRRLMAALRDHGLGHVLDIVPNHMAVTRDNPWWWDVLRNGPSSRYAHVFDVDWDPPEPKLRNQVLLPVLGDHYGRELEAGHIRLHHDGGAFTLRYHEHEMPVAPRSLAPVLADAAAREGLSTDTAEELAFLGRAAARLPQAATEDAAERADRQRDVDILDRRLAGMVREEPGVGEALDSAVAAFNDDVDRLDALVGEQNYRLAFWRTAVQDLDYRRFFDIHSLAGLRTEDPRVFDMVHGRVLELVRSGELDGLRVDHPDGLRRPAEYFERLRAAAPDAWIVVEKILMPDEPLRSSWAVDGTTGYELLNDITGLFVDPAGETPMTELWTAVTGDGRSFHEVALEARRDILREVLGADLNRLANVFVQVCEDRRRYRDFTRRELRDALAEVAASFPVYRTYVTENGEAAAEDVEVVERALEGVRGRRPDLDPELLDLLREVLQGEAKGDAARGLRMRFQQLTGPVAAKGEEDTAFYRYLRFAPLNEVGGDPGRWGLPPDRVHERFAGIAEGWPRTMTTLSTHDTKRAEDVRARLLVLAEIPGRWAEAVSRWTGRNARHWGGTEPDPAMEYLFYQTVVGAWPIDAERLVQYMEKASREAKARTSWTDPDPEYDAALRTFVENVRGDEAFVQEVEALVSGLIGPGRVVSMAQKLVQLTAPGVPDLYQGSELWDLSLVDPDNRRPVDFGRRRALLDRLEGREEPGPEMVREVLAGMDEGLPKLWVVRQALRVRSERPDSFAGDYRPLRIEGAAADHGFGFVRGGDVAVVVPRLVVGLVRGGGWRDTVARLPEGRWRNRFTGEVLEAGKDAMGLDRLMGRFPVGLFTRLED